jgi:transposase
MQFETILRARVPRSDCPSCGVKTTTVPWAGKHLRFTLLFEAFAIKVIQACHSLKQAADLLKLDWDTAHAIMARAVERGLARRSLEEVKYVGVDKKSFLKGQNYVSVLTDLGQGRVLEVVPGRTEESAVQLWESLADSQRKRGKAVAMDMWQPFVQAAEKMVPKADIVFDKFHIPKHLNEAVDTVRRQEHKRLLQADHETLKGTRQLWLYAARNLPEPKRDEFESPKQADLKTA